MSKFRKLFLILLIILVVEMVLIFTRYQALSKSQTMNKPNWGDDFGGYFMGSIVIFIPN